MQTPWFFATTPAPQPAAARRRRRRAPAFPLLTRAAALLVDAFLAWSERSYRQWATRNRRAI